MRLSSAHRLPLLSGILLALAFPPLDLAVLPFVALVPFLWFVSTRAPDRGGRWEAGRGGFVLGVASQGLLLHWLPLALWPSPWAVPTYAGVVTVLALLAAAVAWLLHLVTERLSAPIWLVAPVVWTAAEWAQAHPWLLSFPWLGLGTALGAHPVLASAAELVGARGLTFWVVLVNSLILRLLLEWAGPAVAFLRRPLPPLRRAVPLLLVVGAPLAFGAWRVRTLELQPAATVAVMQTTQGRSGSFDRVRALGAGQETLRALTESIPPGTVDLIVWPEMAVPTVLDDPLERPRLEQLRNLSRRVGAPILVGSYAHGRSAAPAGVAERGDVAGAGIRMGLYGDVEPSRGGGVHQQPALASAWTSGPLHNAALLITGPNVDDSAPPAVVGGTTASGSRPGALTAKGGVHLKRHLVPVIERRPRLIPAALLGSANGLMGALVPGRSTELLGDATRLHGVLICYESAFSGLAREHRRQGARFLVNITNDAWFAGGPLRATGGSWQHPAHLRMRAIETRMGAARAANDGLSLLVDPLGRVYEAAPLGAETVISGAVLTTDVATLYVRWGDWLATAAAIAAVLLVVASRFAPAGLDTGRHPRENRREGFCRT